MDGNFGNLKSFHSFVPAMTALTDTGKRILKQAHDLFMQYGLKSVSMDDIANSLGMSKKTIYQYYADKDQLVEEVVGSVINTNQMVCDVDRSRAENAVHEIFLAMDMMQVMFSSMNPSLLFDMQKYYPGAYRKFSQHKNDYLYGVMRSNMQRGIKEELYRPDLRVDVLARYRVESIVIPFNPEFHTKVKANLVEIQEEVTIHFLFGLVTQKGHKMVLKYQQNRIKKQLEDATN